MNISDFQQKIEAAVNCCEVIQRSVEKLPDQPQELLTEAIRDISLVVEELYVAQEELQQKQEEQFTTSYQLQLEKQRYRQLFEEVPDGYLVTDDRGVIQEANRTAAIMLNVAQNLIVGKPLALFVSKASHTTFYSQLRQLTQLSSNRDCQCCSPSQAPTSPDYQEDHYNNAIVLRNWEVQIQPRHQESFLAAITVSTTCSDQGHSVGLRWLLRDITEYKQAQEALLSSERKLKQQAQQLSQAFKELKKTQAELVQQEKMSSLGRLLAGVAHEINNPIGFISSNLQPLQSYVDDILVVLQCYQSQYPDPPPQLQQIIQEKELDFLVEDLPKLLDSMKIGSNRICHLVTSLRNFSNDDTYFKKVDIHQGIENTLVLLRHRLQPVGGCPEIKVIKKYSNLPLVECYSAKLNQVFMNILSNAIDALEEERQQQPQQAIPEKELLLTICTQQVESDKITIAIANNGSGISPEVQKHIFEPFFTTKPVGKGTGLGLAISHQIVVDRHQGKLRCISVPGQGTEFLIEIPLKNQTAATK
ncbi:ATP-binding protein [Lyngbya aestuarii]|uniref:ATP-binding protein n=1 Tax=Lyngbya aestuarii TaxID=118322 RepID=UPI00403DF6F6